VTRSFTPSTSRSTASTLCFAADAPCWSTALATRLIRVTGDCFLDFLAADRFPADFLAALDRAAPFDALLPDALLPFVVADVFAAAFAPPLVAPLLLVALVLLRGAVRFDAAVDLRRDFPPDDFDAVAIFEFLEEGTGRSCARFARSAESDATSRE
jgi:hypothetical protein